MHRALDAFGDWATEWIDGVPDDPSTRPSLR
jgi:hypothetical protein